MHLLRCIYGTIYCIHSVYIYCTPWYDTKQAVCGQSRAQLFSAHYKRSSPDSVPLTRRVHAASTLYMWLTATSKLVELPPNVGRGTGH